ncbi:hypothetical protein ACIRBX_21730 [Kitasatospora sp. NPDC096147]|uniref:hypothetical protein n=1 Tax=Kitasatospora sp. NPDC096147 TaxID=3364093 RepID=UPI00380E5B67
MIVTLIVAGEVGFWVLLALALAVRYLLRWRTVSTALLLGLPLIDLVILVLTVLDLRGGTTASWTHGLAASYVGFSVAFGHSLVTWADGHFQHRFAGGPRPPKAPKYGAARAAYEWRIFARTALAAVITVGLIAGVTWFVGDPERTAALNAWYQRMGTITAINLVIAGSYTIWPKQEKRKSESLL